MKCRDLSSTIIKVTSPLVTNTTFAVAHELGQIPRGAFIVRSNSNAQLYLAGTSEIIAPISPTNFVGGWEMEAGAGLILDSGPNGYTLTNNNVVTSVAGKVGNAGNFVLASAQSLSRASEAALQIGDIDFTIAAWVKLTTKTTNQVIVSKFGAITFEFQLIYNVGVDRFLMYVYKAGNVGVTANDIIVPATGTWYLLIGWHDATADTVNIQVNNTAPISSATGGALQAAGAGNFGIGYRALAGNELYLNGLADQVMFWKRVLTSTERTALYNSGNGLTVAQALTSTPGTLDAWDATNAYLKCNVAGAQFYVLFFV